MFEPASVTTTAALEGLLSVLSRVDADVSDAERIDQLTVLERVKSAAAAAQVRVTVDFVDSQEQVAAAWRERARECADVNDFEGWRAAREQERHATKPVEDQAGVAASERAGGSVTRQRVRRRPGAGLGVAAQVALARRVSPTQGS